MRNFEGKTLKKNFDSIVFGQIVDPNPNAKAKAKAKAIGPDARTVAEVVAGRSVLNTTTVRVRAQVVKVNLGIMGKNWLHLQDRSGSAADGS